MVTTIKDNKAKYTTRDVAKATAARKLQNVIGCTARDLVIAVRSHIKNCPLTAADAKLGEQIYGPSIAGVRGKTVRRNEPSFVIDQIPISIADKYKTVTLGADIFYVNSIRFFVSISAHIGFGTTQPISNGKVETLANSLDAVVNLYRIRGFRVTLALMDNQFRPLEGHMPMGCQLNVCSAEEHIGLIERYIRTLKERSRCVVGVLPFKFFPRVLTRGIIEGRNFWLNSYPRQGGVSRVYSPRTIVMGKNIDYYKHCQLETGQYVEIHEKTDNTMKRRTEPAIYLHPSGNEQGGGFFMKIDNRE